MHFFKGLFILKQTNIVYSLKVHLLNKVSIILNWLIINPKLT